MDSATAVHAPARGATGYLYRRITGGGGFNPRTRTGCDPITSLPFTSSGGFNPRTRTGCDWQKLTHTPTHRKFQSTHPHGVRLMSTSPGIGRRKFQSTHPHGVRHWAPVVNPTSVGVSIHAPARGATDDLPEIKRLIEVSIHAPARGATIFSRLRNRKEEVSIHAPARGATYVKDKSAQGAIKFQSTHPHGVRLVTCDNHPDRDEFQSTHPHGVRQTAGVPYALVAAVSIHAPARGAT